MNNLQNIITNLLERTIKYQEGFFLISSPPKSFFNPNPGNYVVHITKVRNDWMLKTAIDYPTSGIVMREQDWNRIKRPATAAEIREFKQRLTTRRRAVDDQMQNLRSLD